MNEIKGRVICKIAEILSEMDTDNPDEGIKAIEKILAIPEIAIVDRERNHHPVFWKNCINNQGRGAKICQDCPFQELTKLDFNPGCAEL